MESRRRLLPDAFTPPLRRPPADTDVASGLTVARMNYQEAHASALASFKEAFPEYDDETAEKMMDAFIQVKRGEAMDRSAEVN